MIHYPMPCALMMCVHIFILHVPQLYLIDKFYMRISAANCMQAEVLLKTKLSFVE